MTIFRLTILVDGTAQDGLRAEHGFACWIETDDARLLFDTGNLDALSHNASRLGVPIDEADALVLSHGHYDHTGNVARLLARWSGARVYLHPHALRTRYSLKDDGSVRSIGMPDAARVQLQRMVGRGIYYCERPTPVAAGVHATGPIPRCTSYEDPGGDFYLDASCETPDPIDDDQALYFDTRDGVVVVLGCAHAGVVNTLDYVAKLTARPIAAVIGGMHLLSAKPQRLDATLEAMRVYGIRRIVPAHCTGDAAVGRLREAFPDSMQECQAGMVFAFEGVDSKS